jgi:hypothetical protein
MIMTILVSNTLLNSSHPIEIESTKLRLLEETTQLDNVKKVILDITTRKEDQLKDYNERMSLSQLRIIECRSGVTIRFWIFLFIRL